VDSKVKPGAAGMLGNDWNSLVKGCTGGEDKRIRPNQGYQPVQRAIHEGNIRPQALKNGSQRQPGRSGGLGPASTTVPGLVTSATMIGPKMVWMAVVSRISTTADPTRSSFWAVAIRAPAPTL